MNRSAAHHPERMLQSNQLPQRVTRNSHVIAIASGKGGVGKTNIATNLGIALSMRGNEVCIFDADTSLANINIVLGLRPEFTLEHFLEHDRPLTDIMLEGPRGLRVIPAASGIADYARLSPAKQQKLLAGLSQLESRFDYLLIDTAAGIGDDVLSFMQAAQHNIIVISPEPTSLTDAFSLIKVLARRGGQRPIHIVVNMVMDHNNSLEVFNRFDKAVEKYLHIKVHYLGYVSLDEAVIAAVQLQRPVLTAKPDAPASRCLMEIARNIDHQIQDNPRPHAFSEYWQQKGRADETAAQQADTQRSGADHGQTGPVELVRACNQLLEQWPRAQHHTGIIQQLLQKLAALITATHQAGLHTISDLSTQVHASLDQVLRLEATPGTAFIDAMKRIFNYMGKTLGNAPDMESSDLLETLLQQLHATQPAYPGPAQTNQPLQDEEPATIQYGSTTRSFPRDILDWLQSDTVTQEDAGDCLRELTNIFMARFTAMPLDVRNTVYRSLATQEFPAEEIREIALTLESIYEKRTRKPMRNLEDTFFRLMAEPHNDEQRIVELHNLLQASYKRQFNKEFSQQSDPALLYQQIEAGNYSKQDIDGIIAGIKQAYSRHYQAPYQDERDELLNKALKMISHINQQEASLREGLKNLSSSFQDSVSGRHKLLNQPHPDQDQESAD